jgi:hypothetical protein
MTLKGKEGNRTDYKRAFAPQIRNKDGGKLVL